MTQLSELITEEQIVLDLDVGDFEDCLAQLVHELVSRKGAPLELEGNLNEELRRRESMAVTAIGGGVAIPHAYLEGLPRMAVLFARLSKALSHDSPDGEPVDLVFMLTGPLARQKDHLPLLARLVRLVHDSSFRARLREATSAGDVRKAIEDVEGRHA